MTSFNIFSVCSQLNPSFSLTYFGILRYAVNLLLNMGDLDLEK